MQEQYNKKDGYLAVVVKSKPSLSVARIADEHPPGVPTDPANKYHDKLGGHIALVKEEVDPQGVSPLPSGSSVPKNLTPQGFGELRKTIGEQFTSGSIFF